MMSKNIKPIATQYLIVNKREELTIYPAFSQFTQKLFDCITRQPILDVRKFLFPEV